MNLPAYQPVYALTRGGHLESLHYGAVAVVSVVGELLASCGDARLSTFLRSTAKPFQALPLVMAGGVQHYGLTSKELALICASHSGTDEHLATLQSLHSKIGITEDQLLCGVHPPFHVPSAERLRRAGQAPTAGHHNCSGKHSGMLAFAKLRGWPTENYIDPNHPLQKEIFAVFAQMAELDPSELAIGIDGCSAPNWAAPLHNVALAYARLMDPSGLPTELADACGQVRDAMLAHPDMVGGPQRFDTDLMTIASGRMLSKGGAEGYQGIGLRAGALGKGSKALGIALKISDGDARGWVSHAESLEVLRQLGALLDGELDSLKSYGPKRIITNWRGLEVGDANPVFNLKRTDGSS